jgi:RNA polymerase sigma factor (sigma-70 family)
VLYREHFAALMKVAFLMSDSAAAAEDAVHEVFVRCAPRLASLDHPASYLRAAVVNECRTQHRRRQRSLTAHTVVVDDELPHEMLETRRALATLTPRQRAAVVLRYFVDIPDSEIASILDCTPSTVRSLLHRALKELEEQLR